MENAQKIQILLFMCLMIYGICPVAAQDTALSRSQERRMNAVVLDAVMQLDEYSSIDSPQRVKEYMALFENADVKVFCDLYSSENFLKQIPVSAYAGSFVDTNSGRPVFTAFSHEFRNVRKKSWEFENGRWYCRVALEKSVGYFDDNLVYYPLAVQIKGDLFFDIVLTFVFNESCSECRIAGISCSNSQDFTHLGSHYYIIQKNDDPVDAKRDEGIFVGRHNISYNEFNQGYSPDLDISFRDDDVKVTTVTKSKTPRYDYIQFRYKPRHLRLRLRNELSPVSAYAVSGSAALADNSSSSYTVGVDIGYSVSLSRSVKLGFYTGLGVSFSNISLHSDHVEYSYVISDDAGRNYTRTYSLTDMSQGARFMDLMVPLYLSPEFRLHRSVSLFLDLGVKAYFNTDTSPDPFHVAGSVSGRYDDGTSVTSGQYATGSLDDDFNEFISPVTLQRNPVDIALSGSAGLDINLLKNTLYLQVKAGYEYGVTWSYQSGNYVFYNAGAGIFPLVYNGATDRNAVFRPLADCVSFKRQALSFGIGLMLKL